MIPTLNQQGTLVRIDGICNDITDRIKLEKKLAEEIKQKQQYITSAAITAQEKERSFLGGELHDNINPMLATAYLYMDCAITNDEKRINFIKEAMPFYSVVSCKITSIVSSDVSDF